MYHSFSIPKSKPPFLSTIPQKVIKVPLHVFFFAKIVPSRKKILSARKKRKDYFNPLLN
jgi:hypothetical protein